MILKTLAPFMYRLGFAIVAVCLALVPTEGMAACASMSCCEAEAAETKSSQSGLVGEYLKSGRGIQIADLGSGNYRVSIFAGGLPTSGWDKSEPQVLETDEEDAKELTEGAERVSRVSPTLGNSVPERAILLFDGTEKSLLENWETGAKFKDGLLVSGAMTRSKFRDYRLHLEFKVPNMPESLGQARGNSGVYHQGRYETQVLDSFGFENEINTCGAIYGVQKASVNASLPPGVWQTYDVEFIAARWDDAGKKTENAKLTVRLNGIVIHSGTEVPSPTTAAPIAESPEPGPIYLQDHGNPVDYRNIWILPIDADKLSKRPRVLGYERLAAMIESDVQSASDYRDMAGHILINDLGCVNCHSSTVAEHSQHLKLAPNLTNVGSRLRLGYIAQYLSDPHQLKPGTTMPNVLGGMADSEKQSSIEAISAFLESTGANPRAPRVGRNAILRGERLYKEIGCAVCHAMPDGSGSSQTTISLLNVADKYTANGLALFLKDPHAVRPSDRMPAMHLSDEEAREIASFLTATKTEESVSPNYKYEVFSGSWDKLPDLNQQTKKFDGTSVGLDLAVARAGNNYAIRFHSFFALASKGKYRFHLGSDDGSKLFINDKLIADCDGIHPHQFVSGEAELDAGVHQIRVEYFQGGGEASLDLEWESSELPRQSMEPWLALDSETAQNLTKQESINPELIQKGKGLFQSIGCVNCHSMPTGNVEAIAPKSIAMDQLKLNAGCLSETPGKAPNYYLSDKQIEAVRSSLVKTSSMTEPESKIQFRMAQLNCIACHERNGFGGPESQNLPWFTTTIPEMGEEGRIPPRLTGIGDKLKEDFLNDVLKQGVRHRPYMKVRMPNYHNAPADLVSLFVKQDRPGTESIAHLPHDETEIRALAAGRRLAGTKGLSCAQCHTFGNVAATGIQALDMQLMTKRVRPEWFYRYLLEPTKYRPGTRMPNSFPEGQSVYKQIYEGNAEHQIAALWKYLSQGNDAALPDGLQRDQIVLEPSDRPVIYRNFLDGLSARGIAVGYPGGINVAWDAETMALKRIWQGAFIDASMHWRDRGVGRQKPLGDLILDFENGPSVSLLGSPNHKWPDPSQVREQYRFLGYRLAKDGSPSFRYQIGELTVSDNIAVDSSGDQKGFKRSIKIEELMAATSVQQSDKKPELVPVVRLAHGKEVTLVQPGHWIVNKQIVIKALASNAAQVTAQNDTAGETDLRLSVEESQLPLTVEYTVHW
jgi:cytochrome c